MGRMLDGWKAARAAHKELGDPKQFKADLGPLIAKFEGLGEQTAKINGESTKLEEQLKTQKAKNEAQRDAKVAAIAAARTKVVDATQATMAEIRKVLAAAGDWETPITPLAAKYDDFLKKYKLLQTQHEKAMAEHKAADAALEKAVGAKLAALEQAEKKIDSDRKSLRAQLTDSFGRYREIAKKLDISPLADKMDRLRSIAMGLP